MASFIAIDYETANSSYESICAVGLVLVENDKIKSKFYSLIKPPSDYSYFDPFNISIHGISAKDVESAPTFKDIWPQILNLYAEDGLPWACHYAGFDIRVTESMLYYLDIDFPPIRFYDTCTISKKIWPELINFKLNTVSNHLNIKLDHHNAQSDAEACALITISHLKSLSKESLSEVAENFGYDLGTLDASGVMRMSDSKKYVSKRYSYGVKYADTSKHVIASDEINEESELFGKKLVFTGGLESMTRPEAIQHAVNNGATVSSSVSKNTDYLIVGVSDFLDFENGIKTNKFKDAEMAKLKGSSIEIIDEEDFLRLLS